jgi:hypothetical protein
MLRLFGCNLMMCMVNRASGWRRKPGGHSQPMAVIPAGPELRRPGARSSLKSKPNHVPRFCLKLMAPWAAGMFHGDNVLNQHTAWALGHPTSNRKLGRARNSKYAESGHVRKETNNKCETHGVSIYSSSCIGASQWPSSLRALRCGRTLASGCPRAKLEDEWSGMDQHRTNAQCCVFSTVIRLLGKPR